MLEEILQLKKDLQRTQGHIFYRFQNVDKYIENMIVYITAGIEQGNYVIVIENDRIFSLLYKKLDSLFTLDQLEKVHYVNNYDFYYSQGDFHVSSIISYFSKIIGDYYKNNLSVCTWAHVEWRETKDIFYKIKEFEKEANKVIPSMQLLSVCAYDADRLTESLQHTLTCSHNFVMTDEGIITK